MTNLLGSQLSIITLSETFIFNEKQFVGEQGYQRTLKESPQLDKSPNGFVTYKQPRTETPAHVFRMTVVMPRDAAMRLVQAVEAQSLRYKQNNSRNFQPFYIQDNKLMTIAESVPADDNFSVVSSPWGFARWRVLINKIDYEVAGPFKLMVRIEAEQLI